MSKTVNLRLVASTLLVSAFLGGTVALAAGTHSKCDRNVRYDALDDATKSKLNNGETATVSSTKTDTEFHLNYVYKLVDADPELVQAVFTSYAEQTEHIKALKESTVEDAKGNWARVRYVADTGHWYIPNSHYTVNDTIVKDNDTYLLYWDLVHSEGLTRLDYVDGYMRTEHVGSRTLISYCNYIIPVIKMSQDQVNREGLEGLVKTVDQLSDWVAEVAADQGKANAYVERLRRMLGM